MRSALAEHFFLALGSWGNWWQGDAVTTQLSKVTAGKGSATVKKSSHCDILFCVNIYQHRKARFCLTLKSLAEALISVVMEEQD